MLLYPKLHRGLAPVEWTRYLETDDVWNRRNRILWPERGKDLRGRSVPDTGLHDIAGTGRERPLDFAGSEGWVGAPAAFDSRSERSRQPTNARRHGRVSRGVQRGDLQLSGPARRTGGKGVPIPLTLRHRSLAAPISPSRAGDVRGVEGHVRIRDLGCPPAAADPGKGSFRNQATVRRRRWEDGAVCITSEGATGRWRRGEEAFRGRACWFPVVGVCAGAPLALFDDPFDSSRAFYGLPRRRPPDREMLLRCPRCAGRGRRRGSGRAPRRRGVAARCGSGLREATSPVGRAGGGVSILGTGFDYNHSTGERVRR